jgi:membrane protein YqaA with SNARE-associated domain
MHQSNAGRNIKLQAIKPMAAKGFPKMDLHSNLKWATHSLHNSYLSLAQMSQKQLSIGINNSAGNLGRMRFSGYASRSNLIFLAIMVIIIVTYLLLSHNQAIHSRLQSISQDLIILLTGWGLAGAFLVTVVANTSVIFQLPYPLLFTFLASRTEEVAYLLILTIVGALGCTLGEMISYFVGRGIGNAGFFGDSLRTRIHNLVTERSRLIGPLVFLFAATPFPDDLLLVPLGLSKYGFRHLMFPIFLGKGIVLGALIYTSYRAKMILTEMNVGSVVDPTLLPLAMVIILAFIIFQIHKARREPQASAAKA